MLLALLAALVARRRLLNGAWHPSPDPASDPAPRLFPRARHQSIHDGTHLVCAHPILWVIGPGPNRGLRPLPRALPPPRPRVARAPPVPAPIPRAE